MSSKCDSVQSLLEIPKIKVVLIVSDIRSAYNVGAMFRTADGAGQTAIIASGYSPTPENPKVAKTALGADFQVPWVYCQTLDEVLAIKNVIHAGLELSPRAVDLFDWTPETDKKILLYVGNEVTGLPVELMMKLEIFLQLPMNGTKKSLNVAEAASIAIYELLRKSR